MAAGHAAALDYSPRQALGFMQLAERRERSHWRDSLLMQRLAAHGRKPDLERALRDLL